MLAQFEIEKSRRETRNAAFRMRTDDSIVSVCVRGEDGHGSPSARRSRWRSRGMFVKCTIISGVLNIKVFFLLKSC
jgi:hypothetical protein